MKAVLNGVLTLFILYFKIFYTATSVHEWPFFHACREIFAFSMPIVKLRTISSLPAFSRVISLSFIFSYQISRYNRENNNVGFVVPDQGSLIWSDNFAIPKGCKNKELAEKFMNYMYDPKVSAKNWEFMNCANPNDEALKYHSQAYLDDPMLKIGKESIPKGEWLTDIGDSITMYDRYWTELKAGQ